MDSLAAALNVIDTQVCSNKQKLPNKNNAITYCAYASNESLPFISQVKNKYRRSYVFILKKGDVTNNYMTETLIQTTVSVILNAYSQFFFQREHVAPPTRQHVFSY
jgi:hypothetical protein